MNYEKAWQQLKSELSACYRSRTRSSEIYQSEGNERLAEQYQDRANVLRSVQYIMSEIERQGEKRND